MQEEQISFLQKIEQADIRKIIFSNGKGERIQYRKVCICVKQRGYQIEKYTKIFQNCIYRSCVKLI